jgi:uncharacterized protein (DUF1697 family)
MTSYVALLRAVNLGGRQLAMSDLKAIAEELGLENARTFIASGNLLFASDSGEAELKAALEEKITAHMGKPVGIIIRSAAEMARVAAANPFADQPGNRVVALFLDEPPPPDATDTVRNLTDERIASGERALYVHYPSGQGQSKLRIPLAAAGTARNMNTVGKLALLSEELA